MCQILQLLRWVLLVQAVGLVDKANTEAAALSGGMKRKLQVALALLGGSPVVLCDEPSSGTALHGHVFIDCRAAIRVCEQVYQCGS